MGRNYARMVDTGELVLGNISCDYCDVTVKPGSHELRTEWTKAVVVKDHDRDERFWCGSFACTQRGEDWLMSNQSKPVYPMLHVAADGTANGMDLWNTLRYLLGGRRRSSVEPRKESQREVIKEEGR